MDPATLGDPGSAEPRKPHVDIAAKRATRVAASTKDRGKASTPSMSAKPTAAKATNARMFTVRAMNSEAAASR